MGRRYKIGEFAKNLGVSAGFLKHHEKYGLLNPKVSESGYRYYEFYQAMLVVQCIRLQNMGFTSKEISDILNKTTSVDMSFLFRKKREIVEKKYHLYKEMLRYLDTLDDTNIPEEATEGKWSIQQPEAFYYVENASCGEFMGNDELYEVALRWNEYMPMVETCARFEMLDSKPQLESLGRWNMGLRITKSAAERLDIFRNKTVKLVNLNKCLIYESNGKRERNLENHDKALSLTLEKPLSICQNHSFSMTGDVYSVQQFYSTAQKQNYVKEMVLIPIGYS